MKWPTFIFLAATFALVYWLTRNPYMAAGYLALGVAIWLLARAMKE